MDGSQEGLVGYDFFSPQALLDPRPLYRRLREHDPVHFSQAAGHWTLSRYRDVEAALRSPALSADRGALFTRQLGDLDPDRIRNFLRLMSGWMVEKDPPELAALRKIALRGFAARALEGWHPIVQQTTDQLLDEVQGRGSMDVVSDLAVKLPVQVIARVFGVPERDHPRLIEWGVDIATFWGSPARADVGELASRADRSTVEFVGFLAEIVEERRRRPGSDMISLLTTAYVEHGLPLDQVPALCILILNAGHVTVSDMLANGVNALLSHPAQLRRLKDDPALVRTAVEEMMRYDTSVPFLLRVAKEDFTVGGVTIPAGSAVALGLGAANHDPEKFDDPDAFDVARSPNEHLGFGPGFHYCLGAVLARMELTTCVATLLRRMPDLRRDPERPATVRRTTLYFKGFESLPVTF